MTGATGCKYLNLFSLRNDFLLHLQPNGRVAEWLGTALQKLLQRFESAPDLADDKSPGTGAFIVLSIAERH
jgi:hypothetical protein